MNLPLHVAHIDAYTVTKETPTMSPVRRLSLYVAAVLVLAFAGVFPATAGAVNGPAWKLTVTSLPTHPNPGETNDFRFPAYYIVATNIGGEATSGPITIQNTLPTGLTYNPAFPAYGQHNNESFLTCNAAGQAATCEDPGKIFPGEVELMVVEFEFGQSFPDPSTLIDSVTISGGGAPTTSAIATTTVTATLPDFDFSPGAAGLSASVNGPDGLSVTQAGSHPYQFTIDLGFNVRRLLVGESEPQITGAGGGLRDTVTALPPGLIVNPLASPVHCTEAELESEGCPDASAVGVFTGSIPSFGVPQPSESGLYNMVPVPGKAATFGSDVGGIGVFAHLMGGVRPGDATITSTTNDILARAPNPLVGVQVQLWGDPSSTLHDQSRGHCAVQSGTCPVSTQTTPFLTMPTSCSDSMTVEDSVTGWVDPGNVRHRSIELTDSSGNPTGVAGCSALDFKPTLQARPTTSVADAPSGLSADLTIPLTNNLNTLATAQLRKAVVSLPEGLVLNPSSANGLTGCSSAQIGIGKAGSPSCPDTSKIGTAEVDTPLIDHPLAGSVFVATPHDNPFDSLLAIYVVVDDPESGVIVKLAGHVIPDPNTGRLTTVFDENPQQPFSDFKLDFFGGAAAPLRTPVTCGSYSTSAQLTPWSAPDSGPPADTVDTYSISKGPGDSCATATSALPNEPSFDSGTVSPIAGRYSPFVLSLRRNDGSQQFSTVSVSPPPGLLGKLAGTPYCPEAALAVAANKTGSQEKANPSCPSASKIGTVSVGAGAGPAPYYAQGTAYLTGPYKDAPLSMAIVTPATAGPYDLGTVVVRTALNVDPATAQITATSDSIPQILQGIPLDVRSVQIALDKPNFTLNPTSCDPFAVSGRMISTLGQVAPLQSRFQVAECGRLAFKPKLSLRLRGGTKRGGHPALRAVLTMPEGGANIAKASVALPHSEFLDQAHIGTVCTRVQYAARACPAASVYGHVTAFSPLLDQPLSGPVYLRSSNNKLPDLVAFLDGQIHVDVAGRIDSVKGGLRSTFEAVPDAPVSKFVLEMQGAKKGLLINSTNLCKSVNKATALFDGQNAKTDDFEPVLKNDCRKARRHKSHHHASR